MTEAEFRARCTGLLEQLAARDPARFVAELVAWGRRRLELERELTEERVTGGGDRGASTGPS